MPSYPPGGFYPFIADVYNEPGPTGVLIDPDSIQISITYGSVSGPVFAGPYTYAGGTVTRTSLGVYQYGWPIPSNAPAGVYVATWTIVYAGSTFYGFESVDVEGPGVVSPLLSDTGWWTGSLTSAAGSIPLGSVDGNGIAWALLGVDGMDGVPTVGQVLQRAGDHGGYATPQFYGPRPLTLRIQAAAGTQALRDTARATMQQVVPVSDMATFVYNEPIPKTLQVRRSGVLREDSDTPLHVTFTVGLAAPDPRKYGQSYSLTTTANSQTLGITPPLTPPILLPAQAPPGAMTATNNGNFETRPIITITGPINQPGVYNQTSGQLISFSALNLSAADVLTIDLLNKVATLNGSPRPADLGSAWWVLPPGTSQLVLQGAGAAGATMTLTYSDAWM